MSKKNWISLFSILIALVGGIPGIFQTCSYFSSPKFIASPVNVILGNTQRLPDPTVYTHVFFSLTITNEGEKPLTPAAFDLYLYWNKRWVAFERFLIPENIHFESKIYQINVKKPFRRDLQRLNGPILYATPVNGFLMFTTKEITLQDLAAMKEPKYKFICTDIFGIKHTYIPKGTQFNIDSPVTYPKHGVYAEPKSQ